MPTPEPTIPEPTTPGPEVEATLRASRRPSKRFRWLLAALLLGSAVLRIWFASSGLHAGRYWDERYNVKNLRAILEGGSLEPVTYYYPSFSYLPQAVLLGVLQASLRPLGDGDFSWFSDGDLRPSGYLLCRLLQVGYGVLSIALLTLLARRLVSESAGLWSGFLLAVAPNHVRMSTFFKPDIQLLAMILLALWWALNALDRGSFKDYLLAGLGVGLAMAAKLNGGVVALPLALGALFLGRSQRRHWLLLPVAGAVSVLAYLACNPYLFRSLKALERNQELYAQRGGEGSFIDRLFKVSKQGLLILLEPGYHGPWIGLLAVVGALGLLWLSVSRFRGPGNASQRLGLLLVLGFPVAYLLLYSAATAYAKDNNFLPLLPVTSLCAGAALALLIHRLGTLIPTRHGLVRGVLGAFLALILATQTYSWAYQSLVPTTWERALDLVAGRLSPWEGRVALFRETPFRIGNRPKELRAMVQRLAIEEEPSSRLELCDAEVFAARDLESADDFLAKRLEARPEADVHYLRRQLFRLRGPDVVVLLHPEVETGRSEVPLVPTEIPGRFRIELPAAPPDGDLLSVELWTRRVGGTPDPRLTFDGPTPTQGEARRKLLVFNQKFGRQSVWLSERVARCGGDAGSIVVDLPAEIGKLRRPVRLYRYRADCGHPGAS